MFISDQCRQTPANTLSPAFAMALVNTMFDHEVVTLATTDVEKAYRDFSDTYCAH